MELPKHPWNSKMLFVLFIFVAVKSVTLTGGFFGVHSRCETAVSVVFFWVPSTTGSSDRQPYLDHWAHVESAECKW